jgi:DNA-binding NarL/FixJ family response regulator
VRAVIADDSALVRSGVATFLESQGVEVVGQAHDAESLLAQVASSAPDVAIVDIRMPPTHRDEGLVAAAIIRDRHPEVAVLVLSQYTASDYAFRLIEQSPARSGYLLKDRLADGADLVGVLDRLVAGECVVDPSVVQRLLLRARRANPLDQLTEREREVLALMAEGRSNAAICTELGVGTKTVETHIGRVFTKLGLLEELDVNRRVVAVLTYLRRGEGL